MNYSELSFISAGMSMRYCHPVIHPLTASGTAVAIVKGTRIMTYSYLCAVRTPLDRNERTGQRGQRPRACWCERKALWGPDSGGVGV